MGGRLLIAASDGWVIRVRRVRRSAGQLRLRRWSAHMRQRYWTAVTGSYSCVLELSHDVAEPHRPNFSRKTARTASLVCAPEQIETTELVSRPLCPTSYPRTVGGEARRRGMSSSVFGRPDLDPPRRPPTNKIWRGQAPLFQQHGSDARPVSRRHDPAASPVRPPRKPRSKDRGPPPLPARAEVSVHRGLTSLFSPALGLVRRSVFAARFIANREFFFARGAFHGGGTSNPGAWAPHTAIPARLSRVR